MQCCICQGEELPLWNTCAHSTCQNLKIHPECFIELYQNFQTCSICQNEYVIQFSKPNFTDHIKSIYIQSWYNFCVTVSFTALLFIVILCASALIFIVFKPSELILYCSFWIILTIAIPAFCFVRDIKRFIGRRDIKVLVSDERTRHTILS